MIHNQLNTEYIKPTGYIANKTLPGNTPEHFKLITPEYILQAPRIDMIIILINFHLTTKVQIRVPHVIGNIE